MISRLQYITQDHPTKSHSELCKEACEAGVDWVQLRMKEADAFEWEQEAVACYDICQDHGAKLIINDNVEVAKRVMADGIHLGKLDMHPKEARTILGDQAIIGGTANTLEDIQAIAECVDYIGLGPFRFTETKKELSPTLGLDGYRDIIEQCHSLGIIIPILAIGGIDIDDIEELMQTGIHGIAVSSLLTDAKDVASNVQTIRSKFKEHVSYHS